jgi:GNAT superfamily N-acetyltransferase
MAQIEVWATTHQRWPEWEGFARGADLVTGIITPDATGAESHYLAALVDEALVGVLMFVIQPIGPEMDVPAIVETAGNPLLEAKIRAFHVLPEHRSRGIGTALQRHVLALAAVLGCYQVRSRSELSRGANYAIKRKLGFGMHPAVRTFADGRTSPGVYWVKAVAAQR